jgi:hypothetical protein
MSSFKKLSKSDVSYVPYTANKQWNLSFSAYPQDGSLTIYKGTNLTSSFDVIMDPVTEGQYEGLVYDQINHLFYRNFSGSLLNTSSLANSIYYESASQFRPSSSYFIYDINPNFINNFPTGANAGIRVLGINQDIYGSKILPYNLILSSSAYYLTDDGNGNVYDGGTTHVGNIFYPQGLVIITNQDYQNMFPLPPLAVADIINVKASDYDKTGSLLLNDIARFGTLVTSSIILSGSTDQLSMIKLTGSFSTSVALKNDISYKFFSQGTYDAYYTVKSTGSFGQLTSNKALVRFNIGQPDCDFGFNVFFFAPTPTPTPTQTLTQTVTNTPTLTQTLTNTPTPTPTLTQTVTNTQTNTPTNTQTLTPTQTFTPTQTLTPTPTPTLTRTPTRTATQTPTTTQTRTQTPTRTPTKTVTPTPTAGSIGLSYLFSAEAALNSSAPSGSNNSAGSNHSFTVTRASVQVFNDGASAGAVSSPKFGIENLGPNTNAVSGSIIVYVGDLITISGDDNSSCNCDDNTGICSGPNTQNYGGWTAQLRKSGTGSLNISLTGSSGANRTFTVNNNMALSASLGWNIYVESQGSIAGC